MTGDPYWDSVVFLSGFEGGSVVDESPLAQTVTLTGTTAADAGQFRYGTQSLVHPNTGGMAWVADNAAFFDALDPFTVEYSMWINNVGGFGERVLISQWNEATSQSWKSTWSSGFFDFRVSSAATGSGSTVVGGAWSPTINTWYDVAIDFDGTTYRYYVDGVMLASATSTVSIFNSSSKLALGAMNTGAAAYQDGFNGYLDEVRVTAGVARYADDGGYTPLGAAFPRGPDLDVTVDEEVAISSLIGSGAHFFDTLAQGVGAHEATVIGRAGVALDDIGVSPVPGVIRAQPATASDTIGAHDVLAPIRGVVMLEHLRVAFAQVTNQKARLVASDSIGVDETLRTALPAVLSQGVGIALTQQVRQAIQVIEDLGLTSVLAPVFKYHLSLADAVRVSAALSRFLSGVVSEHVGIAHTQVGTAQRPGIVSEGIGVAAVAAPRMILKVVAADELSIDDNQLLRMIYRGTIAEGVEIAAGYLAPNGSLTTWAVNIRSGAVTEYRNYEFNSFAEVGGIYFGASSSGLYKLLGDDDDGADIIADIKSGFAQWADSKFTLIKGIYLGVRGEGDFVFRLITGDDKTYNYTVSTLNQRTTRVRHGKGLRARYFAFELISTGQDFDLDTIEFVPLVADRRV